MVEFQKCPGEACGCMTGLAVFIELFQVDIGVAIGASRVQGFVYHGFTIAPGEVAFLAGNIYMFPGERESCCVVVIEDFIETIHHVAGFAIFIELAIVGIFLVAVAAISERRFFICYTRGVTFQT